MLATEVTSILDLLGVTSCFSHPNYEGPLVWNNLKRLTATDTVYFLLGGKGHSGQV